jgi:spore germination protein GerM
MKSRRGVQIVILLVTLGLLAWGVTVALERLAGPVAEVAPPAPAAAPASTAHITATLFVASPDGQTLLPVRREVPLAEGVVAQGRQILLAQLAPAAPDQRSAIPQGTQLRAFYVTDRGDAFVDLSAAVSTNHPGGSMNELLTVYTIVNAVTTNLPAVQRVQLLVDGKEADTIAGHVDIRRPLARDESLVKTATP